MTRSTRSRKPDGPLEATEESSKECIRRLRSLLNAVSIPVYSKDTNRRFTGCNHAFEESIGYKEQDLIGKTVYEIAPKDIAEFQDAKDRELFEHPGQQQYEWKMLRNNGEIRDIIYNKATWTNDRNQVEGLVGAIVDVTERNRVEKLLQWNERRFRSLVQHSHDVIAVVSAKGEVTYITPSVTRILGYEAQELMGRSWETLLHPDDLPGLRKNWLLILEDLERVDQVQLRACRKDGHWIWLDVVVTNQRSVPSVNGIVANCRDITLRKLAEERVQELNRTLEQRIQERTNELRATIKRLNELILEREWLEKLIQNFGEEERERIGRDIHDVLGQSLTALSFKSQVLLTRLERDQRMEAADARLIFDTVQKAIGQARDLSCMLFPIELKDCDLAAALQSLCSFTKRNFNISCQFHTSWMEWPKIELTTATHLYRIAQEAISNAIRHGGGRSVIITLDVKKNTG